MLDLSPEKIMALMAIGLVVLGPQRLPHAARTLAQNLARARRLAATLTQPLHDSLAEPRRSVETAMTDVREIIHAPAPTARPSGQPSGGQPDTAGYPSRAADAARDDFDPADN